MKLSIILSFLCLSLTVKAYDAPYGSDGIFHQQRASSIVAFISFSSTDRLFHNFNVVKTMKGKLPTTLKISAATGEQAPLPRMKTGQVFLAFLKGDALAARRGVYSLPMQGMSLHAVSPRMAAKYEEVVADYIKYAKDKDALAERLLAHSEVPDEYIQYSAVRDLTSVFAPKAQVAQALALKLQRGKIRSANAKLDVVEQITRFKLTAFTPVLETMILNSTERVSVRAAGLVSLERMGQTEAIRRVAPTVVNDQSGRLRRIGIDVIKPR
jgi:hypothetical protein